MLYANPGNQPQIANILYVMDIRTHGAANDKICSLTDFWATVARYNSLKVMFHRSDLPKRALPIPKAQPIIEQLIREEVDQLKAQWAHDPCWDIEYTEGFEEHKEELREYREQKEAQWEKARQDRIQAKADELQCSLPLAEYILILEHTLDEMNQALEGVYFRK